MGSSPTQIASFCLYSFLGGIGIELLILGAMLMYYSDHQPDGDYDNGFYPGYNICIVGVEFLVPPILVLLLTPKRVFNYMASRFDSNVEVLEEDGAFIAELLDSVAVTLNQVWYVHYDKCNLPCRDRCTHSLTHTLSPSHSLAHSVTLITIGIGTKALSLLSTLLRCQ